MGDVKVTEGYSRLWYVGNKIFWNKVLLGVYSNFASLPVHVISSVTQLGDDLCILRTCLCSLSQ